MTNLLASSRPLRQAAVCFLGLLLIASPAFAHHYLGMGDTDALTAWQGLLSGLGHPLLGPDHLLFLLALGFVVLKSPLRWVLPLPAVGLGGSVLTQFIVHPSARRSGALGGSSCLPQPGGGRPDRPERGPSRLAAAPLRPAWLPVGQHHRRSRTHPSISYSLGLLVAQGSLLLLVTALSQGLVERLGAQGQRLGAGIWIGIGMTFAWVALID